MTNPAAPPAKPVVPTYPQLGSPSFNAEAYEVGSRMPAVVDGIAALAESAHTNALSGSESASAAHQSALDAAGAAAPALAASNFKGLWSDLSGAISKPASVKHNGRFWLLLTNLPDVAASQPGVSSAWEPFRGIAQNTVITSAAVQQALPGGAYALTNAAAQGSATNIALYSKTFNAAAYSFVSISVVNNAAMGPDGSLSASKLVEGSGATERYFLIRLPESANNTPRAVSLRAKAAGRSLLLLQLDDGWNGIVASFNLQTGVVINSGVLGNGSGLAASMIYEGNGWYDCRLAGTPSSVAGTSLRLLGYLNNSGYYVGDGVSGVYVDDLQIEEGTAFSSRITTNAAAVTRPAGLVAPQRVVLPAAPEVNDRVIVIVDNGVTTNVVDPNGKPIHSLTGPIELDRPNGTYIFDYVNSKWRVS